MASYKKDFRTARKETETSAQKIMNAILYINKTGCQWRMLPSDFVLWQTVYCYFRKWKLEGVFEEVMDALHFLICKQMGRAESPALESWTLEV